MIETNKEQTQSQTNNNLLEEISSSNEAILIMLMRNYDATMALLWATNTHAAERLAAVHEQGKTITNLPYYITEEETTN